MAKLTAQQWQHAREVWECDEREGYAWLVKELGLPVTDSAVRKRASKECWKKLDEPDAELLREKLQEGAGGGGQIPPSDNFHGEDDPGAEESGDPGTELAIGRPSSYRYEYNEIARRMFELWNDCTDAKLGEVLGVCERTIYYWKKQYPEFLQACRLGKELADAEVAHGMYTRAVGYNVDVENIVVIDGKIIIQKTTKHIPPDVQAGKFWLTNRQPEHWRSKREYLDVPDLEDQVSEDELDALYELSYEKSQAAAMKVVGRGERTGYTIDQAGEVD